MRVYLFKKLLLLSAVMVGGIFITSQARANAITFNFTATVTVSSGTEILTGGPVNVGDTITGSYTFDSDTPNSSPVEGFGNYISTPVGSMVATAGNNVFQTDPNNPGIRIQVQDWYPTTTSIPDIYLVIGLNPIMPVPTQEGLFPTISMDIEGDLSGDPNLFDSGALPLVPLPLYPNARRVLAISLSDNSGYVFDIEAQIDTLTLTPQENLANLASQVVSLNLQNGISNSLDSKLDAVLGALDDMNEHNDAAACNGLAAFINSVQAQSGNQISTSDADGLIADAMAIEAQLGCN